MAENTRRKWQPIEAKRKVDTITQTIEATYGSHRSELEEAFLEYARVFNETGGSATSAIEVYLKNVRIPYRIRNGEKLEKASIKIDVPYSQPVRGSASVLMSGDEAESGLCELGPLVEERLNRPRATA